MKKILKLFTILSLSTPISLSVIACSNQPDWNNIPIPPAQIPVDVTGFKDVGLETINIKDYDTVDSLFKTIKTKLANSAWKNQSTTTWIATKDDKIINLKTADLRRNGKYYFEIKSNLPLPGDAKFIITITSSKHIADNMSITNLGQIDDNLAKTILIACVFKNMNLISKINEIADEYLKNIEIDNTKATLVSSNQGYFYGSVTVYFTTKAKPEPAKPTDLKSVITTPDLGTIPDNRYYTILMYVIIKNFVTKLDSLSEIINNLDITKISNTGAILSATDKSKYYSGFIDLKFNI